MRKIQYHLPGLFEFYEFYRQFLPLLHEHPDYFYEWCEIGSIYGAPADCLWGGGRMGLGNRDPRDVLLLMEKYGISARLTFSNSLLRPEHLEDARCHALCRLFGEGADGRHGVIIYSDLLLAHLRKQYPAFYYVSTTTKVLTKKEDFLRELNREEFRYVVPDYRLNHERSLWESLSQEQKDKVEFLCNECCSVGCTDRKTCYENVSRINLGENVAEHICRAPGGNEGYRFSKAMESPAFIGLREIREVFAPMGYTNFKIEGRGLGSAMLLEFLLYYMVKPEHQLKVREALYLDAMLDLF